MRTAICYSGQPRYIGECFKNHYEMIFKYLENFDIFFHFWFDKKGCENNSHMDSGLPDITRGKWSDSLLKNIINDLDPKLFTFQEPLRSSNIFMSLPIQPDPNFYIPKQNIISMFYSIYKSNLLKITHEKENNFTYDCVIRIRSDLFFNKPLHIQLEDLNKININTRKHTDYSLNDCIAYGNSSIMDFYSQTIFNIQRYKEEGCVQNSECFLGWHLKNIDKNIKDIEYNLYREIM
jgi:hypothetical protein